MTPGPTLTTLAPGSDESDAAADRLQFRYWRPAATVALLVLMIACSAETQRVSCGAIDRLTITGHRWTQAPSDSTDPLTIHITGTFPADGVYMRLLYNGPNNGFGFGYPPPAHSVTAVAFEIPYIHPGSYTATFSGLADLCRIDNHDIGFNGVLTF